MVTAASGYKFISLTSAKTVIIDGDLLTPEEQPDGTYYLDGVNSTKSTNLYEFLEIGDDLYFLTSPTQ